MKNLKLIFIEDGLTDLELNDIKGGAILKCPNLDYCASYTGNCPKITSCTTFESQKIAGGGTSNLSVNI